MHQKAAHPSTTRMALERPQKLDKSRVFVALWWGHVSSFDAWPCIPPLVPLFAYKYPRLARFSERRVFRVVFWVVSFL